MTAKALLDELDELIEAVTREGAQRAAGWAEWTDGSGFAGSAENLARYLALRRRDLRPLQRSLMALGLSSLGRLESRVTPALEAVRASLAAVARRKPGGRPDEAAFFAGERLLAARTRALLGMGKAARPVGLMVTCPTDAADDPSFTRDLARRGVESIRINCAADDADVWGRMVEHARAAEAETGRRLRIFMDLGGPKIRTGEVRVRAGDGRVRRGDTLAVTLPDKRGGKKADASCSCTLPEAIAATEIGQRVFYDDGKFGARVTARKKSGLVATVEECPDKGVRLKPGKGLNFPDTDLPVAALTDQDLADLDFVARHADGIGYSFVQSADDVARLQEALAKRRDDWDSLSLILKIETTRAVENLPDMLVRAAGRQPTAIMIARGDLAVEIGFARCAEMQEEIMWLAEAAHTPVIWATEVLANLAKTGRPSRGEMTDAAMATRAECVMLNKGPHILEAVDVLDTLIGRMDEHQHKKTPQLRALKTW